MKVSKLDIFTNFDLQSLNTLGVQAIAGNYLPVKSVEEIRQGLSVAKELDLPILVLGGGSNVVLPDMFVGLVMHIGLKGMEVLDESAEYVWLKVGAGETWHQVVEHCLNFHYWGIENLALIPGTIGAAPMQNIGAYGVELESVFEELTAIERSSQVEITFNRDSCEFSYRDSIFKNRFKHQYIITSVTLRLNKAPNLQTEYPALQQALAEQNIENPNPAKIAELVCQIRRSKLPDPDSIPNAGSFFKNPIVPLQQVKDLRQRYPDLVSYPVEAGDDGEDFEKVAAGWLIDKAGWKGKQEFGVGMHDRQALVLINPGNKSGTQIIEFACKVQDSVKEQFGISLQMEPDSYLQA